MLASRLSCKVFFHATTFHPHLSCHSDHQKYSNPFSTKLQRSRTWTYSLFVELQRGCTVSVPSLWSAGRRVSATSYTHACNCAASVWTTAHRTVGAMVLQGRQAGSRRHRGERGQHLLLNCNSLHGHLLSLQHRGHLKYLYPVLTGRLYQWLHDND